MTSVSKYSNPEQYPFPSTNVNPKLKLQPEYCKKWAKAIYSQFISGGTSWSQASQSFFKDMRAYAAGQQDASQYRSFIKNDDDTSDNTTIATIYDDNLFTKEAKRRGYMKGLFQNLSPAPKILSSLIGLIGKVDYDIMADTIDANSTGMVEFMKYKKFHEAKDRDFQIEYKKNAGIPVDEEVNFPKTIEELEAFEAREGFKLNVAKAMQKILRYSFADSGWDTDIDDKQIDDLVTFGYCTAMDVFDDETQTFKAQWIDPARTVMQFSHEHDYSDSEYGGYFEDNMTISNLRRKRPDLTEPQIIELAKANVGKFDNPKQWNDKYSLLDPSTNTTAVESWKVSVFKAYWIDTDTIRDIYWKGKGSERVIDIGFDSKVKPLTEAQKAKNFKQDVKQVPVRLVYQCSWVVDSDICFDYGKYHMAARPEMTKPKLPLHARQLLQTAIIYRLVPILDMIAVTWLQFLNDLANMVQRGYAINMAMLMNVAMNGKDLDPANILTLWKQKGLLPYMPSMNGNYTGGMPIPITPIEGGLGKRVEETMVALTMYYQQIENTIGINPLSLGATPDPNAPVGTSEAALQATFNVLRPIMDARLRQKESVAKSLCLRIQIGLRVSDRIRKAYAGIVNPSDIKAMIMAESSGTQYGIMLRARPDEAQKLSVKKYLELEVTKGTLSSADAMYFEERILTGADISEIRQELSYAIEKNKEKEQENKMAAVTEQNKGLQELEQQKAQNLAKQSFLETKGKILEEQNRSKEHMKQLKVQGNIDFIKMMKESMDKEKEVEAKVMGGQA